jgi:butyryl-CoA dehydrogenase
MLPTCQDTHTAHPSSFPIKGSGGGSAQHWLVLARSSGAPRDQDGLSLFVLPAGTPGANVHALPTYDGRHTADLVLDGVQLPDSARVGAIGQAWPVVARAIDRATVLLCAESVGAMARCLNATRDYLGTRKQFGQRIIDNQVVKHRLVDMFVAIEQARAITEAATQAFDGDAALRERATSLAKAFVGPAGRRVGEDAVQLHGAIGMTEEYEVGQACKRLAAAANLLGDAHWHGTRLLARGKALADHAPPG